MENAVNVHRAPSLHVRDNHNTGLNNFTDPVWKDNVHVLKEENTDSVDPFSLTDLLFMTFALYNNII